MILNICMMDDGICQATSKVKISLPKIGNDILPKFGFSNVLRFFFSVDFIFVTRWMFIRCQSHWNINA